MLFVPIRKEETRKERNICNEELPVSYSSIDIRVIKSTMADWTKHVARMGVKRNVQYYGCGI
jgi:hypothetical protein